MGRVCVSVWVHIHTIEIASGATSILKHFATAITQRYKL